MGCPGAKVAQGSSCHSHDPSVKFNENYPSDVEGAGTMAKKYRSRYVYSSHCNSTKVDSLLAWSKQKAFKVFGSDFKSNLNGHTHFGGTFMDSPIPVANKVFTGKWSYPRSYAQLFQNNHSVDGNSSINKVKDCESSHKAKLCNTSGNRPIAVVNRNRDGHLTPERLCDEALDHVVHSFTEGSSTTPVNVPHHNSCTKDIAKVTAHIIFIQAVPYIIKKVLLTAAKKWLINRRLGFKPLKGHMTMGALHLKARSYTKITLVII